MKRTKRLLFTVFVIITLIVGSIGVSAEDYGSYFDSMLKFIDNTYYKGITPEEGLKAALKGLFQSLDQYSDFYDVNEMEILRNSLSNNYSGIGAALEKVEEGIKITKIYEASPAENAGLLEGDIIISVDGKSIKNMDPESVAAIIRGEEGTYVRLTVKRGNLTRDFSIKRGRVTIKTVQYRIEGKLAYIKIDSFSTGTAKEFNDAMNQVDKNKVYKIILDLRGNTGGYVDVAVDVAKKLMPEGIVTTLVFKSDEFNDVVYYANGNHPHYIVAVLVDEHTASASEIVAGALEDAGNGFLIGRNTYGKGIFQNMLTILTPEAYNKYKELYDSPYVTETQLLSHYGVFPEADDILGMVKLTTGYYLTPKGRMIHGTGLKPAFEIKNPTYPNGIDLSQVGYISSNTTLGISSYGDDVYNTERVLKALGYFSSTPDRKFESDTYEALLKYQKDNKLAATGKVDDKTRESLNNAILKLRRENDLQYSKAVELLGLFRD